jgi:hypothetical protein
MELITQNINHTLNLILMILSVFLSIRGLLNNIDLWIYRITRAIQGQILTWKQAYGSLAFWITILVITIIIEINVF